ncbi:MAG: hypothetical protein RLZZ539_1326, partial [Pseudomonadota bacterium]
TNHQNQVARCFEKAFALDESARLQIDASDVSWQPNAALFPKANERWDAWQESSRAKSLPEKSRLTIRSLLKKAANDIEAPIYRFWPKILMPCNRY